MKDRPCETPQLSNGRNSTGMRGEPFILQNFFILRFFLEIFRVSLVG